MRQILLDRPAHDLGRLVSSNLERMLAMCFSTVRLLSISSPAISPFDLPCAISAATRARARSSRPANPGWPPELK